MECRQIRTLMHDALSGTLVGSERIVLDRHLMGCPTCRTDFAVLRAVVRAVEEAPPLQPSADFTLKVMDRLPAPVLIFGRVPVGVFWALVGVLGLLAGTLTWFYRSAITRAFEGTPDVITGTNPISASFRLAASAVRTPLDAVLRSLPVPLEPQMFEPVLPVLIAVGVAYVMLKIVDGFELTEFDSTTDESYS